jgi:hypothetical protein
LHTVKKGAGMRRKTIIDGFRNGQKFRVIFRNGGSEYDIGMYMTIQQMTDNMATVQARTAVWDAMSKLANMRYFAQVNKELMPVGLVCDSSGFQVQVDLCD